MDDKNERTLQEAARWYARLHAADCTDADRTAFHEWRQQRQEHTDAYLLAQRVSKRVSYTFDERLQALADEACGAPRQRPALSRWAIPVAFAASALLAASALVYQPQMHEAAPVAYETTQAERRTISLPDGSSIHLDVGTRLTVAIDAQRRRVELLAGRAMFEVAHDASRPFSVSAAGSRTTALGTRFQVERERDEVVVMLAEGAVAVESERAGRKTHAWREQLRPGEELRVGGAGAPRVGAVEPHVASSWIEGRHIFEDTPLVEAVAEVNRYARKKVRLGDPGLADLAVAGSFMTGDSEGIVQALAEVLPLRAVKTGVDEIVLFRRYDADDAASQ